MTPAVLVFPQGFRSRASSNGLHNPCHRVPRAHITPAKPQWLPCGQTPIEESGNAKQNTTTLRPPDVVFHSAGEGVKESIPCFRVRPSPPPPPRPGQSFSFAHFGFGSTKWHRGGTNGLLFLACQRSGSGRDAQPFGVRSKQSAFFFPTALAATHNVIIIVPECTSRRHCRMYI